ncbi:ABC-type transport system involved in multi-copper enzyme maturation, permease component [Nocardia otitidiscaviarum]|uniref:ABC-type transport system involved in multi-copper enzyme maturation, permease component n=1 Tax=Nocardia otitidiscaviarum TaxID=1823 RepID=A0A378YVP5_9NOCA|nr:ABC transporter permease [Nocardia otitidiscaviarum]SUA81174.1 ABC-type transport system involved in multi-copper enzyme maturation, permease component [Nocardia otitidiscaviarum]
MIDTANRFAPGTFAPAPRPTTRGAMLAAQTRLELILLLRNGEQLLLTMFIPITLLIGLTLLPLNGLGDTRVDRVVPAVMMVAIMSTAFTGQAIAVGFDRRYGALKRLGATPLPRWGIVAGKCAAVLIVVVLQSILLGAIGFALGWRPTPVGLVLGAIVIGLGTATFGALGLLLGGTLKAEIVLALANILWFVMLGVASLVLMSDDLPSAVSLLARAVPSGALSEALTRALAGGIDWYGVAVLAVWGGVSGWLATKFFRFD